MYIRTHKNKTLLDNTALQDAEISWQAKGLLIYLLSSPGDWEINIDKLAACARNGKTSISNILNELIQAGYVQRTLLQNEITGKFEGYEYRIENEKKDV